MRVLVTCGSKRGSTAQIGDIVADSLRAPDVIVDVVAAHSVRDLRKYDAVIVGGALYAGLWFAEARHFVERNARLLRQKPVWFFSSGPLDWSADEAPIAPTPQVAQLMAHVGAKGHATFGGRLASDARGFIAKSLAKKRAGNYLNAEAVESWAKNIGSELRARPVRELRSPSTFAPLPSRASVVTLCFLTAITAIGGGATLVAAPDGSLIGLPLWVLAHSPFHDFLVPGLLLSIVVGGGNAVAALLHIRRNDAAPMVSAVTGLGLVIWIVVEMILLRTFHPLQVTYLAIGLFIVGISMQEIRTMYSAPPRPQKGPPKDAPHARANDRSHRPVENAHRA